MHNFFIISLLYSSTCFEYCCAHHQEVKLYYAASGIVTLCRWPSGTQVRTGRPPTECDDTRCCIIQFDFLMMGTTVPKHVEEYNKLIMKQECVHSVGQLLGLNWRSECQLPSQCSTDSAQCVLAASPSQCSKWRAMTRNTLLESRNYKLRSFYNLCILLLDALNTNSNP